MGICKIGVSFISVYNTKILYKYINIIYISYTCMIYICGKENQYNSSASQSGHKSFKDEEILSKMLYLQ